MEQAEIDVRYDDEYGVIDRRQKTHQELDALAAEEEGFERPISWVRFAADGVTVEDLGSTNGTYVNGRRVTSPTSVSRGDTVQIGKTALEVR